MGFSVPIFLLLQFVSIVFGLWVRGKKNLKFGVGKREKKKKEEEEEIWSGEQSKSGLWVRQNNMRFGVGKTKICSSSGHFSSNYLEGEAPEHNPCLLGGWGLAQEPRIVAQID